MIIVYHQHNQVHSIFDHKRQKSISLKENHILKALILLADMFEDRILVWCQLDCKELLNYGAITDNFKIKNVMVSSGNGFYLPEAIGYVDHSPFIKVNTAVKYPTWLMHSAAGAIHATSLLKFKDFSYSHDFNYDLNSIAKLGIPKGLFCYSDPKLLKLTASFQKHAGIFTLFRFVKQHYRTRWVFLLTLNFLWHERKLTILPLLRSLFYTRRKFNMSISLEAIDAQSHRELPTIDVIIPTIGRSSYVHDVLKDLSKQTHLPYQVIIVEQNPDLESLSDLGFIYSEVWPFKIKHEFIHQAGACNARNLALQSVVSEFIFFADDDIRFQSSVLEQSLDTMKLNKLEAVTLSCLRKGEQESLKTSIQWMTFGSGCSIVESKMAKEINFDMAFEFGFGEDSDYGMRLRNVGCDIVYLPNIKLDHLKAPTGGFRTVHDYEWSNDIVQPKPSPTVMLYNLKHQSIQQLKGYKTLLFFKFYKNQGIKNPLVYVKEMNKRWERSIYWAKQLTQKTN